MTLLTHAIIGAGLSLNQRSLPVGFIVSFFSHFLLDAVPHNDYIYFIFNIGGRKKVYSSLISLLIAILTVAAVAALYFVTKNPAVLIGAFAAALPDILSAFSSETKKEPNLFDRFHFFLHTKSSLGEIMLRKGGKIPIRKAQTFEEAKSNYEKIAGNKWGIIGWLAEMLLEIFIFLLGLKVVLS